VHQPRMAVLAAVALLVISACSSSPAATEGPGATQPPGGATQAPGGATQAPATQAPATQAPASQPAGSLGDLCAGMPTFRISNPEPSFPSDPTLEAHFPASIDGSDASNVTSESWLGLVCMFGGGAGLVAAEGQLGSGIDWTTVTFGSADYTVDGDDITLTAFRTPGADANTIVQSLTQLALLSGGGGINGSVSNSNIGGKNVFVFTDSTDGSKSYAYASGDTLIYTDTLTDDEAQKVFSALP
jgi:hypothetical protein